MGQISANDRVKIIQVKPGEQQFMNKSGTVMMIVDGVKCFVMLDDGGTAEVDISQLKKA
jgi:hypothetical protein